MRMTKHIKWEDEMAIKIRKYFLAFLFLGALTTNQDLQAATLFVETNGTDMAGANPCTSSMMPCATIQHAIDQAAIGIPLPDTGYDSRGYGDVH